MAEFVKLNPAEVQFLHEQNPDLSGDPITAGKIELAPITCTFLVV